MHIAYYDESGDDGFPSHSSELFVLSALYLHHQNWKTAFDAIRGLRQHLKGSFAFPVKLELHTRQLLLDKNPYRALKLNGDDRVRIVDQFCDLIASLDVRIVNVAIVKPRITSSTYSVLDRALTYSVQRIENDLEPSSDPSARFMIITDEGRVGKMRSTTRRVQRINPIPSRFGQGAYRKEITTLIEDPLPKRSQESYFIQLADLVAYVTRLYTATKTGHGGFPSRLPPSVTPAKIAEWMDRLKPSLNTRASGDDPYGVVMYPK
jgi:hypothetical protein